MSTRRSGRATKEVKYTSASEGSDFEDKKKRSKMSTTTTKKTPKAAGAPKKAPPKKSTKKRAAESDDDDNENDATAPKLKRQKKDPEALTAEAQEKQAKAEKAAHKKAWQDWLSSHDVEGEMLEEEPGKEKSITQTDALKKYAVKKDELRSLLRFEKKNPLYPGTMKLFLEEDVRELAFRKMGMLEGARGDDDDEEEVVERGEEIWTAVHKDNVHVPEKKPAQDATEETRDKPAINDTNEAKRKAPRRTGKGKTRRP